MTRETTSKPSGSFDAPAAEHILMVAIGRDMISQESGYVCTISRSESQELRSLCTTSRENIDIVNCRSVRLKPLQVDIQE